MGGLDCMLRIKQGGAKVYTNVTRACVEDKAERSLGE
jgi:hypothetical protein